MKARKRTAVLGLLAVAASAGLAGCRGSSVPGDSGLEPPVDDSEPLAPRTGLGLSALEEHMLGRAVAARILSGREVHPDRGLHDYVTLVGLSIVASRECAVPFHGWRFVVLQDADPLALSSPCGCVHVSEGAVRSAGDEDELAAVLAHEMAHVSLRHPYHGIGRGTRERFAKLEGSSTSYPAWTIDGDGATWDAKHAVMDRMADEIHDALESDTWPLELDMEADRLATRCLRQSGYDPGALRGFLEKVAAGIGPSETSGDSRRGGLAARIEALSVGGAQASPASGRDVRGARFALSLGR